MKQRQSTPFRMIPKGSATPGPHKLEPGQITKENMQILSGELPMSLWMAFIGSLIVYIGVIINAMYAKEFAGTGWWLAGGLLQWSGLTTWAQARERLKQLRKLAVTEALERRAESLCPTRIVSGGTSSAKAATDAVATTTSTRSGRTPSNCSRRTCGLRLTTRPHGSTSVERPCSGECMQRRKPTGSTGQKHALPQVGKGVACLMSQIPEARFDQPPPSKVQK